MVRYHEGVIFMRRWRKAVRVAGVFTVVLLLVLSGITISRPAPPVAPAGPAGPGPGGDEGPAPIAIGVPVAQAAAYTLTPLQADDQGIDPRSGFLLAAPAPLTEAALRQGLTISPATEYQVQPAGDDGRSWRILPAAPLKPGQVYRLALAPGDDSLTYRWAFQVREQFRVLGTLPRDAATGVPVNTGIEFTFSHPGYGDPTPYFRITPEVPGRFERHGPVLVFVPTQELQPGTLYTVTLRAGLPLAGTETTLQEEIRFQFETAVPGRDGPGSFLSLPADVLEFSPRDTPFLALHYGTGPKESSTAPAARVALYRYPDGLAYARALARQWEVPEWAQATREARREDPSGLAPVATFTTELHSDRERYYSDFLIFPEPLPPGYYLADITVGERQAQVHLQVTDLAAYTAVTTTETLVWMHRLATGVPAAGVQVELLPVAPAAPPVASARSGPDGLATLPTPPAEPEQHKPLYLLARAPDGAEAVIPAYHRWDPYFGWYGRTTQDEIRFNYWRYLYLDRRLYKPDDTVYFWGVLRPREEGAVPVREVTLELVRSDYRDPRGRELALASATVPVSGGIFTGSLSLPNVRPGWYEVRVLYDGQAMQSQWLEVQTYTKPAYQLELTADKRAVMAGDTITFTVQARFFEGTPVPGLALRYAIDGSGKGEETVTTGPDGRAVIRHEAGQGHRDDAPMEYRGLRIYPANPEGGEISAWLPFMVFTRDTALTAKARTLPVTGATEPPLGEVTVRLNQVDLTARNAPDASGNEEYRAGPVAGQPVAMRLMRLEWLKVERGQYYDFIEKRVVKLYDYKLRTEDVARVELTTAADGTAVHRFPLEPEQAYEVIITTTDQAGRRMQITRQLWGHRYTGLERDYEWYGLAVGESNDWNLSFAAGESMPVELRRNDRPLPDRPGGYLFYTARRGLGRALVAGQNRITLPFLGRDIPGTHLYGIYFDGRTYQEASRYLRYNPAEQELQVRITPDRPEYRPGERVQLTVEVTEAAGRPVDAAVNLNLVDEALYALAGQRVDLLRSLYSDFMPTGILATRSSHRLPRYGPLAEKGGDGGEARRDFRDAIFFETVQTGADGRATAEFQVPDNLTAWRVTYQAVAAADAGPDLRHAPRVGSGTIQIPVRLPFFAEVVLGETFLVGDDPEVTVRTYGTALRPEDQVTIESSLTGPDGTRHQGTGVATGAYAAVTLSLPRLEQPGTYTVRVEARGPRGLQDSIERRVTVQETYYLRERLDFYLLTPETRIAGAPRGITYLTFTDYRRSQYLAVLQRLAHPWGHRLERQLGAVVAQELLKTYFTPTDAASGGRGAGVWNPGEGGSSGFSALHYQTPEGGLAILPYADADLALTARLADLAPTRFDRVGLVQYLRRVADNAGESRERQILALYGLAALGEPVLNRVNALLNEPDLTRAETAYLMLAATALGNHEPVRPRFQALLQEFGEAIGPALLRLNTSIAGTTGSAGSGTPPTRDEMLAATAWAAVVAARLQEPGALPLLRYVAENQPLEILLNVELLLAAREGLARLPEAPVAFSYLLDGQEVRRELGAGESLRMALTPEQWQSLRFTAVSGEVGLTLSYLTPEAEPAAPQGSEGAGITRTYQVQGRATQTWQAGDLIKITLRPALGANPPSGAWEVTDYLPAGLRPVAQPYLRAGGAARASYPIEVLGQRVTFIYWPESRQREIVYYARVVTPGTYTAEAPTLQHAGTGVLWARGVRQQVSIQ